MKKLILTLIILLLLSGCTQQQPQQSSKYDTLTTKDYVLYDNIDDDVTFRIITHDTVFETIGKQNDVYYNNFVGRDITSVKVYDDIAEVKFDDGVLVIINGYVSIIIIAFD